LKGIPHQAAMTFIEEVESVEKPLAQNLETLRKQFRDREKLAVSSFAGTVCVWALLTLACRALNVARALGGADEDLKACGEIAAVISRQKGSPPAHLPYPKHLRKTARSLAKNADATCGEWHGFAGEIARFAETAYFSHAKRGRFCRFGLLRRARRSRLRRK